MTRWGSGMAVATGLALFAGCADGDAADRGPRAAVAEMSPTRGHRAAGTVTFTEVDGGLRVVATFVGVPVGVHGFHVHEHGDCASDDGTSAGDHWNPDGAPHGARLGGQRHVGDLGNVAADPDRVVTVDFVDRVITFDGPRSILGKAVILHLDEDDLVSQPSGAAGARISCGVIRPARTAAGSG